MKIRTLQQVNERARDGRVYSAGQDALTVIDDTDTDMVELARSMAARRIVEIVDDEPKADAKTEAKADTKPESKPPAKKTTGTARGGE